MVSELTLGLCMLPLYMAQQRVVFIDVVMMAASCCIWNVYSKLRFQTIGYYLCTYDTVSCKNCNNQWLVPWF